MRGLFRPGSAFAAASAGGESMKRLLIGSVIILAIACKVEKTGKDTYKVVAPTPEAKAAAEKAKEQVKVIGEEAKKGAADAAVKVGGALQKAGEKTKAEAKEIKNETRSKTTTHN